MTSIARAYILITDKTEVDQICYSKTEANKEKRDLVAMGCAVDVVECIDTFADDLAQIFRDDELTIAATRRMAKQCIADQESDYALEQAETPIVKFTQESIDAAQAEYDAIEQAKKETVMTKHMTHADIKAQIKALQAMLPATPAKKNPARNKYLKSAQALKGALQRGALGGVVLWKGASLIDGAPIAYVANRFADNSGNTKTGAMVQTFIVPIPDENGIECNGTRPAKIVSWLKETGAKSICGDCPHAYQKQADGTFSKGSCYVREYQSPAAVMGAVHRDSYPIAGQDFPLEWVADIFAGANVRFGSYGDPAAAPANITLLAASKAWRRTGYTHGWKSKYDGFRANAAKLQSVLMASADSVADQTIAESIGWRCFRVAPLSESLDVSSDSGILCPASDLFEEKTGKKTDCASCGLCSGAQGKGAGKRSVVIPAHGGTAGRVTGATCPAALKMLDAMKI